MIGLGVLVDRVGPVTTVTMDWPEVRNAIGWDEALELAEALSHHGHDEGVSGIVLTGNGAFCAGGNLRGSVKRSTMSPAERREAVAGPFQGLIRTLIDLPVPTVAAVDGPAIGMGFDIALACDSRFVGPDGWFLQGWGRIGLTSATGGELLLRMRSPGMLWKLLEEQRPIHAEEAARMGICEAASSGAALAAAQRRMGALSAMGRPALCAYVESNRMEIRRRLDEHLALCADRQVELLSDPGYRARVERVLGGGNR